jgi:hypothetical protein
MSRPLLQVILVSTRQGRQGPPVARWFAEHARQEGSFAVELVDLAEIALPLFDEPEEPATRRYLHAATRRWSETVARADAFVFVTPEYNALPQQVAIPSFTRLIGEDGIFRPTDAQARAADRLLAELARWTDALAPLRRPASADEG